MVHIFAYGTLQFPQIIKRLTGKNFAAEKAMLRGYRRLLVKGTDYPAVKKSRNSSVDGILLKDVDEKSLEQIIQFEGDEYEMVNVRVHVNGSETDAVVFAWIREDRLLDEKDWNQQKFESDSLRFYR